MIQTTTLKPGLLVSLHTSIRGNVKYSTREIEGDHITPEGTRQATRETERTVLEPEEQDRAIKVRSKCSSLIRGACITASAFGLLCPEGREESLDAAIRDAQSLVAEFNAEARTTRIGVYVLCGRVAADDAQAVRAINAEVTELLDRMENGLRRLDPEAVREAASKAKAIGAMLSPAAAERVQKAVAEARSCARRIVSAGEVAASEIDRVVLGTLANARTAFLDLDDAKEVEAPTETGRALDLTPIWDDENTETPVPAAPKPFVSPFELDAVSA